MTKPKKTEKIRLRFPPSPTGPAHIGTVRTILFNYLFAKQNKGETVLRIEDTDKERSKLEWVQNIIDELHWLGIDWDEGPDVGGPHSPYKQSQRTEIYQKYLEQLLTEKKAYYCNCSAETLEEKKQKQTVLGLAPKYDGTCRDKNNIAGVIRFKIEEKKVHFEDMIRGRVEFDMGLLGDMVIAKDLQTPLYHFAVVVDDFEMKISHIIRGEDHISNTPKQILLQEALDFYQPIYAHIPLLLNPNKSKMSKRAGDVAVSDFHKNGYLPEAIINFIVLLGWNPGTEKELFTLDELVKEFSLQKVQKAGAVFNIQRLDFINGHYIKEKPIARLVELCLPYLAEFDTAQFTKHQLEQIVELHRPRLKKLSEISAMADYFFKTPQYDTSLLAWAKMSSGEVKAALQTCKKVLEGAETFNAKSLEELLSREAELFNLEKNYPLKNKGYLLWPMRVALSGREASAGPFEIAEILGKEKTLQRINDAISLIS
ncbi:MAG TPA: glutamate--tRNA ligase [Negativicutes bacterium]|nr:MAG: glutamate--tRNA ligase [Candidatus Staskawiczbacteria bacterium RIFCSPLOWO2_01_FULL_43_17b]HLD70266.1 glutamate--tRNA ligase [Negativicutes bacterium]